MKLRSLIFIFAILGSFLPTHAHVGSPNIFYEGEAGPYPIRVMIRPPRVVPGLAEITVRAKTNGITQVTVLPARWDTGRKGAPPPDIAIPVKGETNLYTSQLWLMNSGAYSVFVNVDGASGPGTAIVPVNSLATTRLKMQPWMGGMFFALGTILFIGLAALVGTAAREGSLPINAEVDPARRERELIATAVAVLIATCALYLGHKWWSAVDNEFQRDRLYKPVLAKTEIKNNTLILREPDKGNGRNDLTPLVPDHGKMMHLFLIEKNTGQGFAHLHPTREEQKNFRTKLPPLPAGPYHVYADVTHESGLTETWISEIDLPSNTTTTPPLDKDDAFTTATPTSNKITLPNNGAITFQNNTPFTANAETTLQFDVENEDGTTALLEPYLGMYAHAVIWKTNGQVFTHLHPLGTISMTSQLLFARREQGENLANQPLDIICGAPPKQVTFPYSFPEPGDYRVWVQVKINGAIHTSAFTTIVQ